MLETVEQAVKDPHAMGDSVYQAGVSSMCFFRALCGFIKDYNRIAITSGIAMVGVD